MDMDQQRCEWVGSHPLEIVYHDTEWGIPVHDDRRLFEFLTLEGAQAGLSWLTSLRKRDGYRRAFDDFDIETVAAYDDAKVEQLLNNPGIVRNRLKVRSTISNAQLVLDLLPEFGTFDAFIWGFADGKPVMGGRKIVGGIPATTPASDAMSKELKKRGFKFVGSTICYAFMQATGMVNDHVESCFRYEAVQKGT